MYEFAIGVIRSERTVYFFTFFVAVSVRYTRTCFRRNYSGPPLWRRRTASRTRTGSESNFNNFFFRHHPSTKRAYRKHAVYRAHMLHKYKLCCDSSEESPRRSLIVFQTTCARDFNKIIMGRSNERLYECSASAACERGGENK
jgi:hypothetical protein